MTFFTNFFSQSSFMTSHFDDRNVNTYRVFANETSQFLAPYEASVKPRTEDVSPPEVPTDIKPGIGASASHVRIVSRRAHHFFSFLYFVFEKFVEK